MDADGVDVKLAKVEYVNNYDEYSEPENGRVIKVYLKFKNNNEDQVLVDSTDFSMKVNGENYQEWYGESEGDSGFSHQLNKGNTGSGMITYDVPENDTYTLEMDATPNFENIKAKWNIKKEDIKEASNQQTSNSVSASNDNESTSETADAEKTDTEKEDDESDEITYPAEMYNTLVDEYNELTDGEKMDHVDHEVLEIEYDQLEARVDELYNKKMEEEDQAFEEEMKKQDEAYEKEMDEIDKEYEEEMDEIDKEYEEDMKQSEEDETAEDEAA
ncbi:RNA-binding protein [Staphylococcus cohnii subsp. cohnii]|nr:RNA-binding protein [Staphylococcus cohnii subsp. cohnii]KKD26253.1 RNA-binding protein [Staphylococcus cohnii subsp. cohnii]